MAELDAEPFLKLSNSPLLSQFLHECVDDLIGKTTANFNNYNSDIEWTLNDYNFSKNTIQNLYRQFVVDDKFDLKNNTLAENLRNEIRICYEIRKDEIYQALVEEAVVNRGHNLVKNIDWRLKWVMGTSGLATLRKPLLQVDLQCKTNEKNDCVNFEVNLDQLDNLLSELTEVQKELQGLQ